MTASFWNVKKQSIVATAILFVSFSISCKKRGNDCPATQQFRQLTTNAMAWFPYTGNTTITFENASSATETVEISNYFSGEDDVWVGDECPLTKGQFLRATLVEKVSNDTISVEVGFGDEVQIKKKSGYILYYENRAVLISPSQYRRFENTITINSKTFTSVLVYECAPTDKCTASGITKFYYAKNKGLVAFERNGVTWTLKG